MGKQHTHKNRKRARQESSAGTAVPRSHHGQATSRLESTPHPTAWPLPDHPPLGAGPGTREDHGTERAMTMAMTTPTGVCLQASGYRQG